MEYSKDPRCNITKFIQSNYEKGTPLEASFFSDMNWREKYEKEILIEYKDEDNQMNSDIVTIKDTIMGNVINYLPIEYYKNYITLDWVESEYGSYSTKDSIINVAFHKEKFDFIKVVIPLFHDLYEENKTKNLPNQNYKFDDIHIFYNNTLKYFLSFPNSINFKNYESFFEFLLPYAEKVFNDNDKIFNKHNDPITLNMSNWFNVLPKYINKTSEKLILEFSQNIHSTEFFIKALEQMQNKDLLINDTIITNLMYHNHEKLIHYLKKEVSNDKWRTIGENVMNLYEADLIKSSSWSFKKDSGNLKNKMTQLFSIIEKEQINIDIPLEDNLILSLTDEVLAHKLIKNYPALLDAKVFEKLNLAQWCYISDITQGFMECRDYEKNKNFDNTHTLFFTKQIKTNFSHIKQDITIEQKAQCHDYIMTHMIDKLFKDKDPKIAYDFYSFALEKTLTKDENVTTKIFKI